MKLIVFSDSHREQSHMRTVIELERPDYVFHLGDHDRDAELLEREYPTLAITSVKGNCDGWSDTPETRLISLGGLRFFLCHGHTYGVKSGMLRSVYAAKEQKADVLLFGHTHCPYQEQTDGLIILNPGTCGYGARPTYGFFELGPGRSPVWGLRNL